MTFLRKTLVSPGAAVVLSLLVFTAPASAGGAEEALSWVPADAVSVGVVRVDALRSSPLASRLFEDTDQMAADGDAARFLEETGLRPKQDVDLMVVAGLGGSARGITHALVVFEGRFDPARLSAALEARGATRKRTPHGEYLSLEGKDNRGHPGAFAFVSPRLLVAGSASAVTRALEDRAAGKSGFLRGEGLGRHLSRVPAEASAWAIVDATRAPIARGHRSRSDEGENGDPAHALMGAMKSVSLFVFHATARGDSVEVSATGLSADDETRDLLADALKGVVAMWRLAVHEKSPELVPILRRFEIENDGEGVTVSGTLPSSFVRKMTDRRQARK